MAKKKETTNAELARMIGKGFAGMDKRFAQVDRSFADVDARFDAIDKRLDRIKGDLDHIRTEILRDHEKRIMRLENLLGMATKH